MSIRYKIKIKNRQYSDWTLYDATTLVEIDHGDQIYTVVNPIRDKLFDQDVFIVDGGDNEDYKECHVELIHSITRTAKNIPGVLVLEGNRTYGKPKPKSKKALYKCIPDDSRMPEFLVPYQPKLDFQKNVTNMYIVFQCLHWEDKHPRATIIQNIGPISLLPNYYEYQLYCKSLYASIQKFTKATRQKLKSKKNDIILRNFIELYGLERRGEEGDGWEIFSVDSRGSRSFDDACSVRVVGGTHEGNTEDKEYIVSIYISNVYMWLEALGLWGSFSERVSTIYLPDKKRPMLPTVLSDNLCSLVAGNLCPVLALDLRVSADRSTVLSHSFKNVIIRVRENLYHRDLAGNDAGEDKMHAQYRLLADVTSSLNHQHHCFGNHDTLSSSHDVISYLMILMNYYSAVKFRDNGCGIFRSFRGSTASLQVPEKLPSDIKKFIKMWHSNGSVYELYREDIQSKSVVNDQLNVAIYTHITSPIRRLVDLINMSIMTRLLNDVGDKKVVGKDEAGSTTYTTFYEYWTSGEKMQYINTSMRSIRRIQNNCSLLDLCARNPSVLEKIYEGYIFDKIVRTDGLFQYMVYLPELRITNRITNVNDVENYTGHSFKLYLFTNEIKFKSKIRLEMVSSK